MAPLLSTICLGSSTDSRCSHCPISLRDYSTESSHSVRHDLRSLRCCYFLFGWCTWRGRSHLWSIVDLSTDAWPPAHSPRPTTHSPQPTTHNPQPTTHNPQPTITFLSVSCHSSVPPQLPPPLDLYLRIPITILESLMVACLWCRVPAAVGMPGHTSSHAYSYCRVPAAVGCRVALQAATICSAEFLHHSRVRHTATVTQSHGLSMPHQITGTLPL